MRAEVRALQFFCHSFLPENAENSAAQSVAVVVGTNAAVCWIWALEQNPKSVVTNSGDSKAER